ncbi:MAG: hypothetical protein LBT50_05115, partial [Prevotellaceae bacterium]|nr:hypothetical protein [Prevotellaceae bacterium]
LSATGILLSINGILLFPIAMLRSGIAMSRSAIGIWRESNESFDMPDGKYACQSEKYEKTK